MDERTQFAVDLQNMKLRAMNLGLYATAKRMDYPIRMVGFEMSGNVEDCAAYESGLDKVRHG